MSGRSNRIRRVVVTGGSGRLGRHVLRELSADYDVINADLADDKGEYPYVRTDIMNLAALVTATRGADAVCHIAGMDLDRRAPANEFIRVNALGSWHVLQAAAQNGVGKVILTSSVAACGLSEMRPDWLPQYLPVDEEHDSRPAHAYGVSKVLLEQMGASFARGTAMSVICLRPVAVLEAESIRDYMDFVAAPDRRWLFYYVTASDVARAFRLSLEADSLRFDVFFLSAVDTSRPEPTLDWYARVVGSPPDVVDRKLYNENPRASVFSSDKARRMLGWIPTSDFCQITSRSDGLDL
jgi:UDP-glucose 4-epimerase